MFISEEVEQTWNPPEVASGVSYCISRRICSKSGSSFYGDTILGPQDGVAEGSFSIGNSSRRGDQEAELYPDIRTDRNTNRLGIMAAACVRNLISETQSDIISCHLCLLLQELKKICPMKTCDCGIKILLSHMKTICGLFATGHLLGVGWGASHITYRYVAQPRILKSSCELGVLPDDIRVVF